MRIVGSLRFRGKGLCDMWRKNVLTTFFCFRLGKPFGCFFSSYIAYPSESNDESFDKMTRSVWLISTKSRFFFCLNFRNFFFFVKLVKTKKKSFLKFYNRQNLLSKNMYEWSMSDSTRWSKTCAHRKEKKQTESLWIQNNNTCSTVLLYLPQARCLQLFSYFIR